MKKEHCYKTVKINKWYFKEPTKEVLQAIRNWHKNKLYMFNKGESKLKKFNLTNCDLTKSSIMSTSLNGIDLSSDNINGIKIGVEDLNGSIIDATQSVQIVGILGVIIK